MTRPLQVRPPGRGGGTRLAPGQTGFTLIDVLISAAIMVIALSGATNAVISAAQMRKLQAENIRIAQAVSTEMANVEATSYDQIMAQHNGRSFPVLHPLTGRTVYRAQDGDVDGLPGLVTITAPPPFNDPTVLIEITVRIDWVGSFGPRSEVRSLRLSRMGS